MLLNPIDTLSGINVITNENLEALEQDDEECVPLVEPENQEDEDSELIVDSDLDQGKLADLLDDDEDPGPIPGDNIPDEDENAPDGDEVMPVDDDPDQCDISVSQDSDDEAPSLVLEPRPTRERRAPERYNPASGESYLQCHHLQTQRHPVEKTLEYKKHEAQVVANVICKLKAKCHGQVHNL